MSTSLATTRNNIHNNGDNSYHVLYSDANEFYKEIGEELNNKHKIIIGKFRRGVFASKLFCLPIMSKNLFSPSNLLSLNNHCSNGYPISLSMLADMKFVSRRDAKNIRSLKEQDHATSIDFRDLTASQIYTMCKHNTVLTEDISAIVCSLTAVFNLLDIEYRNMNATKLNKNNKQYTDMVARIVDIQEKYNNRRMLITRVPGQPPTGYGTVRLKEMRDAKFALS